MRGTRPEDMPCSFYGKATTPYTFIVEDDDELLVVDQAD